MSQKRWSKRRMLRWSSLQQEVSNICRPQDERRLDTATRVESAATMEGWRRTKRLLFVPSAENQSRMALGLRVKEMTKELQALMLRLKDSLTSRPAHHFRRTETRVSEVYSNDEEEVSDQEQPLILGVSFPHPAFVRSTCPASSSKECATALSARDYSAKFRTDFPFPVHKTVVDRTAVDSWDGHASYPTDEHSECSAETIEFCFDNESVIDDTPFDEVEDMVHESEARAAELINIADAHQIGYFFRHEDQSDDLSLPWIDRFDSVGTTGGLSECF